jgi:hypothetical protein
VFEIRIHTGLEHRVFYVAKYEEAVYRRGPEDGDWP